MVSVGSGPRDDEPSGPLSILLSCPQCGGPSTVDDDARSAVCAHCGSFLIVDRPGRDEIFLAESLVTGADEIRRIVIAYRVQAHRAELIARYSTEGADGTRLEPPELLLEQELRRFEESLAEKVHVVEAHPVEVPYWHLAGTILQGILGRQGDGPKEMRIRAFAVEHTAPGYDTRKANLRDRGLRLARARVHPLSRRTAQDRGPFLPWVLIPEEAHREVDRWRTRDLDPGTEPVTKRGDLVFVRRFLVYRRSWLARVLVSDAEQSWVLVDGGFATIGGYPGEVEARALLAATTPEPERAELPETKVYVHPSRCPDCGAEVAFASRSIAVICGNCQLGLEPRADGIRVLPYDHAASSWNGPAEYLPFWIFPARLTLPGAPPIDHLEEYARLLYPKGAPPGFALKGEHFFVPAFRLLGTEAGDECFQHLAEWIHGAPPEIAAGKVPLGQDVAFRDATLSEGDARETLPFLLYAVHDKPSAARLNTLMVRKLLDAAQIPEAPGRLVFVPLLPNGEGLVAPGTRLRLSRALLDDGPEIAAQRVTVFRPGLGASSRGDS
jgi:ribosomal protein S27E